jgi:hypothetical protein
MRVCFVVPDGVGCVCDCVGGGHGGRCGLDRRHRSPRRGGVSRSFIEVRAQRSCSYLHDAGTPTNGRPSAFIKSQLSKPNVTSVRRISSLAERLALPTEGLLDTRTSAESAPATHITNFDSM